MATAAALGLLPSRALSSATAREAYHLILPAASQTPPVPATRVETRGRFALWLVGQGGLLEVLDTVGPPIKADRTDLVFIGKKIAAEKSTIVCALEKCTANKEKVISEP